MGKNVFANNMEIACQAGDGKVVAAFPDVCMSPPSPPAGPIPIPYPNSSFSKDTKSGSKKVKIGDQPIALQDQSFYQTSPLGDEASTKSFGANLISHVNAGKTYFIAYSMDVKAEGKSVCRAFDLTTSNHASPPAGEGVPSPNLGGTCMGGEVEGEIPEPVKQKQKTWIKYRVVDDVTHKPVTNVKLLVTLPDDSKVDAVTNGDGEVEFQGIDPGVAYVTSGYRSAKADSSYDFVGWGAPKGEVGKYATPDLAPPYQIVGAQHRRVRDNTSIKSFADGIGISWQQLAKYNWDTDVPKEINKKLVQVVGCTRKTADGQNYMFRTYDIDRWKDPQYKSIFTSPPSDPGHIWLPMEWSRVGKGTTRTHIIRVRRRGVAVKTCSILDIEAKCQHVTHSEDDDGSTVENRRTARHLEILEVVPSKEGEKDRIALQARVHAACAEHPVWEISSDKGTIVTNELTTELEADPPAKQWYEFHKKWVPERRPRKYRVAVSSCNSTAGLEVHAYPCWKLDHTFKLDKVSEFIKTVLQGIWDYLADILLEDPNQKPGVKPGPNTPGVKPKKFTFDFLKGALKLEMAWKEHTDHRVFFWYKISGGFFPFLKIEFKVPITLPQRYAVKIAKRLKRLGKAAEILDAILKAQLTLKFSGSMDLSLNYERRRLPFSNAS